MDLLEELKMITPNGYSLKSNYQGYAKFELESNFGINTIGLGDILNGSFIGLKARISFFSIEEILRPAFATDKDTNYSVTLTTDQHGFIFNKAIGVGVYEYLPLELNSPVALETMRSLILRFVEQDALPFFEYWKDIRCFLPFIETSDIRNVVNNVFAGDALKKKMVIWKLCSHPQFEKLASDRLSIYEQAISDNPNDAPLKKESKAFQSFVKQLQRTEPLYEWDPEYLKQK